MLIFSSEPTPLDSGRQQQKQPRRKYKGRGTSQNVGDRKPKKKRQKTSIIYDSERRFLKSIGLSVLI